MKNGDFSNHPNFGPIFGSKTKNDHISGTAEPISKILRPESFIPIQLCDKNLGRKLRPT